VKEFFNKYFHQFTKEHCDARETNIKKIFAPGLTNTMDIRFHTKRTNKGGKTLENTGITALKIKGGKVIELQDFYSGVLWDGDPGFSASLAL
jgi:ketosteroid isomerase-like protein